MYVSVSSPVFGIGSVLRGDINYIEIGNFSNLQDGVIGHLSDEKPLIVGNYVTVGHGAIIHACTIEDECLIGMNATVLDGAVVGKQSIVAAGTVVPSRNVNSSWFFSCRCARNHKAGVRN